MGKTGLHIINCITAGILLLLFAAVVAVQIPSVQNRLADKFITKLENAIDGKANIGDINVQADGSVFIKDLLILDSEPYTEDFYGTGFTPRDTFFYAKSISATVELRTIFGKNGIHLRRARVDGGVFHLVTEPYNDQKRTNLEKIFNIRKPENPDYDREPITGGPDVFSIRNVILTGFNFTLQNFADYNNKYPGFGLNYSDLDLRTDIEAHNLKFAQNIMSGTVDELSLVEKSGYTASHISGECRVGSGKALIENIHLIDPWSDLKLKFFCMTFRNSYAFGDFLNKVSLEGIFKPSKLAIRSIAYLGSGTLRFNDGIYEIHKCHVSGPVSNMLIEDFTFNDLYSETDGLINGRIYGLPDIKKFGIEARVEDMHFTTEQLSRFISSWAMGNKVDLSKIAPGTRFTLNATSYGLLNELNVKGVLRSEYGTVEIGGNFDKLIDNTQPIRLVCQAATGSLDAGRLLNVKNLGEVALDASANMSIGKGSVDISIDSLNLKKAVFKDYEFKDITANGKFDNKRLKASLQSSNPDLKMNLITDLDFNLSDGGAFNIAADFGRINLKELHVSKDEEPLYASASLNLDVLSDSLLYLDGTTVLRDINLTRGGETVGFGDILVNLDSEEDIQNINIDSKIFRASLTSDKEVTALANDILNATARKNLSALCPPEENPDKPGNFDLQLTVLDNGELVECFIPDIYIEKGTKLVASLRSDGIFRSSVTSGRIAKGANYLKDVCVSIDNSGDRLNARISGSDLKIGAMPLLSPSVTASARNNAVDLGFSFNGGLKDSDSGNITVKAEIQRDLEDSLSFFLRPESSSFTFADEKWQINPSGIFIKGKGLGVDNFRIASGNQSINLDGGLNLPDKDTLKVFVNDFDLAIADNLTGKKTGIAGNASGKAYLVKNVGDALGMLLSFRLLDLKVGDADAGDIRLASNWDEEDKLFRLQLRNSLGGRDVISAEGFFSPEKKDIHAEATVSDFALGTIAPLLSDTFSETGGRISGIFIADGPIDKLKLSSRNARFNNSLIHLAYTDVPYLIDGPFEILDGKIHFDNLSVIDNSGGIARLEGDLAYNDFKNMSLDASMNFNKLKLIDLEEDRNSTFYGLIKASGNARVYGPVNALTVDAQISTDDRGNIHVPLSGSLSSSSGELLTFIDHSAEDPYETMLLKKERNFQDKSDIHIKAHLQVNEGLDAFMEIDKSVGNVISFAGNGQVNLDIRPSKAQFNLNGDYSISSGKYHFVLPGVLEKDLNIKPGSSIKMGGDLMDSQIDLTATYNVKTSLGTLIADTTGVATRRNVECGLSISNKLRNPDISFLINIDDLDPSTKNAVEAALNTEDKVQKQFVALLLLGSFIPSEQSGVFNGTNMLYSNLSEVVSSQFNSILNKLDIPLDFGFSYQSGTQGKNMFDVAISTQLFNNRVNVSGSVGNRQYKPNSTVTNDVVGDVDIQIKLDKDGQYRMNLFSHSADSFTNFLDNTQRNGVGFSFQKDFKPKKKEQNDDTVIVIENE